MLSRVLIPTKDQDDDDEKKRVDFNAPDKFPAEDFTDLKNKPSSLTWKAAVRKNKPG